MLHIVLLCIGSAVMAPTCLRWSRMKRTVQFQLYSKMPINYQQQHHLFLNSVVTTHVNDVVGGRPVR